MAGLPAWSKWELVEQFAGLNIAKIIIISAIAGAVAIKSIRDEFEDHVKSSEVAHTELSLEIETTTSDLMEQINLNYTANEVNRQIGVLELRRDALQGRLDSVVRVIETNPNAVSLYREDRDQYIRDLLTLDTQLANLRSLATGSTF